MLRFLATAILIGTTVVFAAPTPQLLNVPFDAAAAEKGRADWAKALDVPPEFENALGMKFVLIPPGRFTMGPNGSTHRVTLGKPFYVATTEVTLGQYRRFKKDHWVEKAAEEANGDDRPAAMVSWEEARAFCRWLSEQPDEKKAGRVYSLPTEARWEWAARAGSNQPRPFGDDPQKGDKGLTDHAWFNHTYTPNPKEETAERGRQPVGKLKPNAWGLYDTLGNVWEWCDDRRTDEATGEERQPVMRGGSWRSGGFHCTAVAHDPADPKARGDHIGFRVVCEVQIRSK
jgi:formylglycine-generating enzyme required for sulfatase activity